MAAARTTSSSSLDDDEDVFGDPPVVACEWQDGLTSPFQCSMAHAVEEETLNFPVPYFGFSHEYSWSSHGRGPWGANACVGAQASSQSPKRRWVQRVVHTHACSFPECSADIADDADAAVEEGELQRKFGGRWLDDGRFRNEHYLCEGCYRNFRALQAEARQVGQDDLKAWKRQRAAELRREHKKESAKKRKSLEKPVSPASSSPASHQSSSVAPVGSAARPTVAEQEQSRFLSLKTHLMGVKGGGKLLEECLKYNQLPKFGTKEEKAERVAEIVVKGNPGGCPRRKRPRTIGSLLRVEYRGGVPWGETEGTLSPVSAGSDRTSPAGTGCI
jgi:hypothetical protein